MVRPPSPQVAKWRSISHLIMCEASGRGSCGPNTSATSPARAKPSSSAASQPSWAGVASWVRNATWSPAASSIMRLRVPPCENSDFGIRWMRAPWRSAISSEPSVEPESTIEDLDLAVDALGAHGAEHLVEVARPVEDGHGDGDHRLQFSFRRIRMASVLPSRSGAVTRHDTEVCIFIARAS